MTITLKSDVVSAAEQIAVEHDPILAAILPGPPSGKVEAARLARTAAALRERPGEVRSRARQLAAQRAKEHRTASGVAYDVGSVRRRQVKWGVRPPPRPDGAYELGSGRWLSIDQQLPLVAKHLGQRIVDLMAESPLLASLTVRRARDSELPAGVNGHMKPGHAKMRTWAEIALRSDNVPDARHELEHVCQLVTTMEAAGGNMRKVASRWTDRDREALDERLAERVARDPRSHVGFRELHAAAVSAEVAATKAGVAAVRRIRAAGRAGFEADRRRTAEAGRR